MNEEVSRDYRFCHRFYEDGVNNCVTQRRFVFTKDKMEILFIPNPNFDSNKPESDANPKKIPIYFCTEVCMDSWKQDQVYDKQIQKGDEE